MHGQQQQKHRQGHDTHTTIRYGSCILRILLANNANSLYGTANYNHNHHHHHHHRRIIRRTRPLNNAKTHTDKKTNNLLGNSRVHACAASVHSKRTAAALRCVSALQARARAICTIQRVLICVRSFVSCMLVCTCAHLVALSLCVCVCCTRAVSMNFSMKPSLFCTCTALVVCTLHACMATYSARLGYGVGVCVCVYIIRTRLQRDVQQQQHRAWYTHTHIHTQLFMHDNVYTKKSVFSIT